MFGLAPALHASRVDCGRPWTKASATPRGTSRLRHGLVVLEVALALLLVVSAGLLANSFVRLVNVDPGFDTAQTLAIPLELPDGRYPDSRVAPFYAELLGKVRALPGVIDAAATSTNPFRQFGFSNNVTPEERAAEAPPNGLVQAGWRSVTPGFFETMGIPVLGGRTFADPDPAGAERVVVVSASLARRLWPGEPAIGKRIYWGGTTGRTRTVVGVSGDVRDLQLEAAPAPMLFLPHAQIPTARDDDCGPVEFRLCRAGAGTPRRPARNGSHAAGPVHSGRCREPGRAGCRAALQPVAARRLRDRRPRARRHRRVRGTRVHGGGTAAGNRGACCARRHRLEHRRARPEERPGAHRRGRGGRHGRRLRSDPGAVRVALRRCPH